MGTIRSAITCRSLLLESLVEFPGSGPMLARETTSGDSTAACSPRLRKLWPEAAVVVGGGCGSSRRAVLLERDACTSDVGDCMATTFADELRDADETRRYLGDPF